MRSAEKPARASANFKAQLAVFMAIAVLYARRCRPRSRPNIQSEIKRPGAGLSNTFDAPIISERGAEHSLSARRFRTLPLFRPHSTRVGYCPFNWLLFERAGCNRLIATSCACSKRVIGSRSIAGPARLPTPQPPVDLPRAGARSLHDRFNPKARQFILHRPGEKRYWTAALPLPESTITGCVRRTITSILSTI